jgi:LVIVD repeat
VKRFLYAVLTGALLLAGLPVASAGGPTAGGFASDNVEWVSTIPLHADSAGASLVGKYFYITTERDLTIYDVSDPVSPQRTGQLIYTSPGVPYFPEEDPETNGKILLVGNGGTLMVIDVEDKTNPQIIGEVSGADEHTVSCVLNCKWAYGSEGVIVDLRNPAKPEIAGDWTEGNPVQSTHDVTEVAPGLVMTSSQPMMLLDARKDPAHPKMIAMAAMSDQRFIHSNLWPNNMKDSFFLVGGEASGPGCSESASATFMTFSANNYKKTKTFTMIDEYRLATGLPTEGRMVDSTFCVHWFDTQPGYKNGGIVSIAWYEQGVRFLDISKDGKIKEVGYFIPYVGSTSASYWITDEILYTADYNRGLDILRFTD